MGTCRRKIFQGEGRARARGGGVQAGVAAGATGGKQCKEAGAPRPDAEAASPRALTSPRLFQQC